MYDDTLGFLLDVIATPKMSLRGHEVCSPSENVVGTGQHKHKCSECGTTWKHDNLLPMLVSHEDNVAAHSCPTCGTQEWTKFGRW